MSNAFGSEDCGESDCGCFDAEDGIGEADGFGFLIF